MSYEGYSEWRCACGATRCVDVYFSQPTECRCGKRFTHRREVDQTNGFDVGEWAAVEYRQEFNDYIRMDCQ